MAGRSDARGAEYNYNWGRVTWHICNIHLPVGAPRRIPDALQQDAIFSVLFPCRGRGLQRFEHPTYFLLIFSNIASVIPACCCCSFWNISVKIL